MILKIIALPKTYRGSGFMADRKQGDKSEVIIKLFGKVFSIKLKKKGGCPMGKAASLGEAVSSFHLTSNTTYNSPTTYNPHSLMHPETVLQEQSTQHWPIDSSLSDKVPMVSIL